MICWVSVHVLDERSEVSVKTPPKRRNARQLRCAETQQKTINYRKFKQSSRYFLFDRDEIKTRRLAL
jgi:hypothetical protein